MWLLVLTLSLTPLKLSVFGYLVNSSEPLLWGSVNKEVLCSYFREGK